jgi:hypothetical protein
LFNAKFEAIAWVQNHLATGKRHTLKTQIRGEAEAVVEGKAEAPTEGKRKRKTKEPVPVA